MTFSPDGKTLASGGNDLIRLLDAHTGEEQAIFEGHPRSETGELQTMLGDIRRSWRTGTVLTFSPDGNVLASAGYLGIRLWDPNTGSRLFTLSGGHTDDVYSLAFSPDGKTLASGGSDRTVILWDVATGGYRRALEGHTQRINALAFSPDGGTLMSGGWDGTILLWEIALAEGESVLISPSQTPWDVNRDGVVDILDLTLVASGFGQDAPDINGDGVVNILDLTLVGSRLNEKLE